MAGPAVETTIKMSASGFPGSVARGRRGHAHFRPLCCGMAALGTRLCSVRRLHCSAAARAGSQWRLQQGLAASPSGYGPLTELPDWTFAGKEFAERSSNFVRLQSWVWSLTPEIFALRS
ncbi:39S ribosomal protein L52, mitochondrial isoform X6 [Cricetulus griseus]|uniref:Large ribosomal subunit protein mL52 n=1 Tax=Cricetulus griseus TaxID=10029 RepID=A0A9J7HEE7_CRIGR|nr:39S ribosomal protein L52, mitochondrial isoform X6 [Cricetulus griseus]